MHERNLEELLPQVVDTPRLAADLQTDKKCQNVPNYDFLWTIELFYNLGPRMREIYLGFAASKWSERRPRAAQGARVSWDY